MYKDTTPLATIGQLDTTIQYTDRPTVKVVIKKDEKLLIINNGLLPGGGVDPGESEAEAIARELQEELGATVKDIREIGIIVQYRSLIKKKYIINGYTASLESIGGPTNPQNEGEARFTTCWLTLDEAEVYVQESIDEAKSKLMDDSADQQSKLYNLMTTYEFLKAIEHMYSEDLARTAPDDDKPIALSEP